MSENYTDTPEPQAPTIAEVAWAVVRAIMVTIVICVVFGAIAMVAWNALTSATGLPTIDLREAAAAVLLLRAAVMTARV
jgi:hypothetical protein